MILDRITRLMIHLRSHLILRTFNSPYFLQFWSQWTTLLYLFQSLYRLRYPNSNCTRTWLSGAMVYLNTRDKHDIFGFQTLTTPVLHVRRSHCQWKQTTVVAWPHSTAQCQSASVPQRPDRKRGGETLGTRKAFYYPDRWKQRTIWKKIPSVLSPVER